MNTPSHELTGRRNMPLTKLSKHDPAAYEYLQAACAAREPEIEITVGPSLFLAYRLGQATLVAEGPPDSGILFFKRNANLLAGRVALGINSIHNRGVISDRPDTGETTLEGEPALVVPLANLDGSQPRIPLHLGIAYDDIGGLLVAGRDAVRQGAIGACVYDCETGKWPQVIQADHIDMGIALSQE